MTPPFLTVDCLAAPNIRHGFFGRAGGVSSGIFASLNTGPGSGDDLAHVAENRRRCAAALGVDGERLVTNYQIHSPDVLVIDNPHDGEPHEADAIVTNTPGLALGALAADCMPWLFADAEAGVIAAAHAGWRGALAGVLENTVAAMIKIGASPENIAAGLGPCLRQPNFEVGLDLVSAFTDKHPNANAFFAPGRNDEKRQFDLAAFAQWRFREVGVCLYGDTGECTLAAPEKYFSYRASRMITEGNYGRNLSAIALV
ncbi:MAG: peptidoglycan editing factor PgeF [Marinicaulis sp.]|nr:peptidoglycan editing factor PgeF [Marinicaulis sp.]